METAPHGRLVLIATALVAAVLGTIHAFSVFLLPLETTFSLPRATVSLTYSFALVCLTLAVTFGPLIYSRAPPFCLILLACLTAAVGALWAARADSIEGIWLGYSLGFGAANGLGYGFGLQFAAHAMPTRKGWAMGVVTAAYALGAAVSPPIFTSAVASGGFPAAMHGLAAVLVGVGLVSAGLIWISKARYRPETAGETPDHPPRLFPLWLAYAAGVAAGLMAIGHAAGLAEARGISGWTAPAVLAVCNLSGSLVAGVLMDRMAPRRLLAALAIASALALAVLALVPGLTLIALGGVGFAYGGTIAAYPAAIATRFPGALGPKVYGRVFTAWGAAGLAAPWLAGRIFDATGVYGPALWLAAVLAAVSAILAGLTFAANSGPAQGDRHAGP